MDKEPEKADFICRLIILQRQSWALINMLRHEKNNEVRQFIYEQLKTVSQKMGQLSPPLNALECRPPLEPEIITRFWAAYNELTASGVNLNHAAKPQMIAVNLAEMLQKSRENKISMPMSSELQSLLHLSVSYKFVGCKSVTSKITHKSVRCYVFSTE